jgi:hypothetical protein
VYLHIAVYLPVKGHMALSNDVCLRSEPRNLKQLLVHTVSRFNFCSESFTVGHILKVRRDEGHAHSKRLVYLSSSLVRSLALALSPPMMDPTHRPVGRSQATTDAQDRVGWFINLPGFAMPSHKMLGQNEMDPGVAALHWKP